MPLHHQAQVILEEMRAAGVELDGTTTPDEAREMINAFSAAAGPGEDVHRVVNRTLSGPAGDIPVRIYWSSADARLPVLVWFHGGGWVLGNVDTHDNTLRALTNAAGCVTVSVDYRLAPEHRFPAAVEDAFAATQWVGETAAEFGLDPDRIAVGGDSAGGNLAAVVALLARDAGAPRLVFQVLVYPVTDRYDDSPSTRDNATGYFLETRSMEWFYEHYLGRDGDGSDWCLSVLNAPDLSGLPPAAVVTAEYDLLRDQGLAYAKRLADAGVPVESKCFRGVFHGFFGMQDVLDPARDAANMVVSALKDAFQEA